ncbi:F0F1 ATP synthase subunit B [Oricola sp.]|uniref:F0F1 ATP synthase subunit B n=1 Tax=Oricola sp. TaxID=1979950 RepID=UPI000C8E8907|nr:ATP F0F1 synthase subunit B [Ahrensia sp.]|tara:strand:- start:15270 stop:15752 length:483 start_codon:yes stop_codon:yes gene_type:complete
MGDATFWALVALIIFLAVVVYLKVPGMIGKSLDERAEKIRNELEEARKLREEAQALLAEYQKKRKEAEKEAGDIVDAAKREAEMITTEAKKKTEEYVARRTALAEQKIAQAEADAMDEVRGSAVDMALAAATMIIGDKVKGDTATELFKKSLDEVKTRMN